MGEEQEEGTRPYTEQEVSVAQARQVTPTSPRQSWPPPPTVLTWQDLTDLPRQILPEETVRHLRNAGREASLAVLSLVKSINRARAREASAAKVRKHIDVE